LKDELNNQTELVIENTKKSISKKTNPDGSTDENLQESKTLIKLKTIDEEGKGVVRNAIKELAEAFSKGVEIAPALKFSPEMEEVLKNFPDTTKVDYTKMKELVESTGKKTET